MSAAASDASVATFGEAAAEISEDNEKEMEVTELDEMVVKTKPRQRSTSVPWQSPAGAPQGGTTPRTAADGAGGGGCMYVRIHTPPRAPSKRGASAGPER